MLHKPLLLCGRVYFCLLKVITAAWEYCFHEQVSMVGGHPYYIKDILIYLTTPPVFVILWFWFSSIYCWCFQISCWMVCCSAASYTANCYAFILFYRNTLSSNFSCTTHLLYGTTQSSILLLINICNPGLSSFHDPLLLRTVLATVDHEHSTIALPFWRCYDQVVY